MQLKNKVILVAGGAGRIGFAIVREILNRGGIVVIFDIKPIKKENLLDIDHNYLKIIIGSINNPHDIDQAIKRTVDIFGRIDGAIQSAYPRSDGWGTIFEQLDIKYLNEDLTNQLGGTIIFSKYVIEALKKNNGGSLVLISSIQGLSAPKFRHYKGTKMLSPIEYTAIKAGVNSVARYLAKYLVNKNIRVNIVSPGGIFDNQPEDFIKRYREECINKGMLEPEDITGAVCFLLSDDSKYINGQNIVVDDGWSL